jgi:hypothetical protein
MRFLCRNIILLNLLVTIALQASIVQEKISDDFYFVMEKLTPHNIAMWKKLSNSANYTLRAKKLKNEEQYLMGLMPFILNLDIISRDWDNTISRDLSNVKTGNNIIGWVAYASNKPRYENMPPNLADIEMAVTVTTGANAWFYSPMGISRWLSYSGEIHKGISVPFLSFIGRLMKEQYPQLEYMVTSPAESLFDILKKNIPKECFKYFYRKNNGKIFYGDKENIENTEAIEDKENKEFWLNHQLPKEHRGDSSYVFFSDSPVQYLYDYYVVAIPIAFFQLGQCKDELASDKTIHSTKPGLRSKFDGPYVPPNDPRVNIDEILNSKIGEWFFNRKPPKFNIRAIINDDKNMIIETHDINTARKLAGVFSAMTQNQTHINIPRAQIEDFLKMLELDPDSIQRFKAAHGIN